MESVHRDRPPPPPVFPSSLQHSNTHSLLQNQGYKLGVAATLALWVVWDCVVQVAKFGKPTIVAKMGFPVFRGVSSFGGLTWGEGKRDRMAGVKRRGTERTCTYHPSPPPTNLPLTHHTIAVGGLLLLHWCWGILENVCNYLRINFVYLLDLSPKNVSSPKYVRKDAHTHFVALCPVSMRLSIHLLLHTPFLFMAHPHPTHRTCVKRHQQNPNRKIFDEAVNESIVYLTCMLLYYKARPVLPSFRPFPFVPPHNTQTHTQRPTISPTPTPYKHLTPIDDATD